MATSGEFRSAARRGVSPVIGVVLLVAIVVALAAVVGVMATSFEDSLQEPAPTAQFDTDYDPAGAGNGGIAYVNLSFDTGETMDGDRVYIVDSDGNRVRWVDVWTGGPNVEPGEYVHVDGKGSDCELNRITEGETYRLVWERENGDAVIVAKHEIETSPETDAGPYTC
jgi:flagellin-like protein